jgi:hypothetical protein
VTVTNPDTQQATQPTGYSYTSGGPPTVSSVTPSAGPAAGGSPVTITGTNFQSGATVDFGGMLATNVVVGSGNLITATVPPHQPAIVTVRVTNPDGQSGAKSAAFTFQGPPALSSVAPASGSTAGGTRIVLYGTGFAAGATVTVNGVQAFDRVVTLDGTSLSVVTPPGTAGSVNVIVTNPAGTPTTLGQSSGLPNSYTYVAAGADPTIGVLSPAFGSPAGGTTVTILGNNFAIAGITSVAFAGKPGSSVTVVDSRTLTVVTPSRAPGAVAVSVINPGGLSVTKLDAFTFEAGTTPPSFAGLSLARAVGPRSIELSWPAASDNGTPKSKMRYDIYVSTSTGGQKFAAPEFVSDPGATRFTVGGLAPGNGYFFVVRARDELGNADSNTVERTATTPSTLSATPWPADGALANSRRRHSATLLGDGRVLVAGGDGGSGSIASAEIYDPAFGAWSTTGSMGAAREAHAAVLLPNGKVLVTGGLSASGPVQDHTATLLQDGRVLVTGGDNFGPLNTAELYSVATGTWVGTSNTLNTARNRHTATLLSDGRVLVAAGNNAGALSSCELFDPTFNSWSGTGSLTGSRRRHTAVRLRSGFVLATGGDSAGPLATTELYDPGKGSWTAAASLGTARESHTATLLPDGRLVVAAGRAAALLNSSEAYDPVVDAWATTGNVGLNGRIDHTATMLPTGRVLVTGGDTGGAVTATFRFDPARGAGSWYSVGSLIQARRNHNATLLPDGRVLVVAGESGPNPLTDAELFDPEKQSWTSAGSDTTQRSQRGTVLLPDGRVLLASGDRGTGGSTDCTLYRPDAAAFSATSSVATSRSGATAVVQRDGRVLLLGGFGVIASLDAVERFDGTTGTWTNRNRMIDPRRFFTATVLTDGKILAAAGENFGALNRAELYDPATGSWTFTGSNLTTSRRHHSATLLPGGRVLIAAGHNTGYLSSAELYNPASGTFTGTGGLAFSRRDHTATLLADGRALIVGGRDALNALTSAELYDPAAGGWTGTGALLLRREAHTATLLPDGRVLVTGGLGSSTLSSCELFDPGKGFADDWRPFIQAVHGNSTFPASLTYSTNITIHGARLRGLTEGGGGGRNDSSGDVPVVVLVGPLGGEGGRSQSGPGRTVLTPASAFEDGKTLLFRTPPASAIGKGHYLLRVVVNGIPSIARIVHLP